MDNTTKSLINRSLLTAMAIAGVASLIGCGGGDSSGDTKAAGSSAKSGKNGNGGDDASGDTPSGSGGGTRQASAPSAPTGAGAAGNAAGQAPVASAKPKVTTPPPGARRDPFRPWFDTTPPMPAILDVITPVRLAANNTGDKEVQPGIEIEEVPNRRVAGILTGNGIYALLDTNGEQKVVKPGDVLDDGYRVVLITASAVTLKKTVNTQTFTQVVPLTDAGSAQSVSFTPAAGVSGPGRGVRGGLMGSGGGGRGLKGNGGGLE